MEKELRKKKEKTKIVCKCALIRIIDITIIYFLFNSWLYKAASMKHGYDQMLRNFKGSMRASHKFDNVWVVHAHLFFKSVLLFLGVYLLWPYVPS